MREPLTPYKGPHALNYLCIIATELLGETHLRNIPTLVAGFDAILQTLSPNVAQAIRNVRLAGVAPWSMRELRLMVDAYREAHRRQAVDRSRGRQSSLWSDDEEPSDGGGASDERPARNGLRGDMASPPEPSVRFTIDEQFNVKRAWTQIRRTSAMRYVRSRSHCPFGAGHNPPSMTPGFPQSCEVSAFSSRPGLNRWR